MTQLANVFNIRWLVERAVDLEAPPSHAPGLLVARGIPAPRKYTLTDQSKFMMPNFDGGVRNLLAAIEDTAYPEGLDPIAATYGLLGKPRLGARLVVPAYEDLLDLGIGIPSERVRDVRRLGLAVVIRPSGEELREGYLSASRVGGVARITTLLSRSGTSADDAWVDMAWSTSASGYCRLLESLRDEAQRSALALPSKTAALIVSRDVDASVTAEVLDEIDAVFAVHGLGVEVLRAANMPAATIRSTLARARKTVTIGLGHEPALRDLYSPRIDGESRRVELPELDGTYQTLRDELCSISMVSAGLQPLGSPVSRTTPTVPRIPVTNVGRCLHDGHQRPYVEDADTGLWWTKDTAGHAGTVFKTYVLSGNELHHEACRDKRGAVIDKWKGQAGKVVALVDLHACGSQHL